MNFIEFRDNKNFHDFRGDGCLVDPKNGIFEKKISRKWKINKVNFI